MTIHDFMSSQELTAYWETLTADEAPYPCEELFPDDKKRGLSLKWIKGSKGLPVALKVSAFDANAVPRARIGFTKLTAEMPYFKESMYIDEELRQELNMVLETGNQAYIDSVMNKIFDDETSLLRGAKATRERMRMMALTTGVISMLQNGQSFSFDYGVTHKGNVAVKWSETATSDPIEDIRVAKEKIQDETGAVITRAMCDGKTWRNLSAPSFALHVSRVMTHYLFAQRGHVHVRIYLRSGYVFVSEHLLDGSQAGSSLQQGCGEGVAQGVWRDRLLDARVACRVLYHYQYHGAREVCSAAVEEHILLFTGLDVHDVTVVHPFFYFL